jgi:alpha-galactosidase
MTRIQTFCLALPLFAAFALAPSLHAQTKSHDLPLAPTPLMGWGTWNYYGAHITEAEVKANADALVASGLSKLGYTFVNVDGHWQGDRDAQGVLHSNPVTFPDMADLGPYLHARGLKFGIYSGPGPFSCGGNVASYGHEYQDAAMFASWGVDYLKYDLCTFRKIMAQAAETGGHQAAVALEKAAYEKMHLALRKTGRPIYFATCQYGDDQIWKWAPSVHATMYRTTDDIKDNWLSMTDIGFSQAGLTPYIDKGHYADPDQLEVGNGGMTPEEDRLHFSLWAMVAAPLILGNDLTKLTPEIMSIIGNKEVIAIDQDPLVHAADRVWAHGEEELWARKLSGNRMAVALFNRTNSAEIMSFQLSDIHWTGSAHARDVWAHQDLPTIHDTYTTTVPKHGVAVLVLSK